MSRTLTSGTVWLHQAVHSSLLAQATVCAPEETGGLLLGYRTGRSEVVIADVIGAGPGATHRATRFVPDHDWQSAVLADRYAAADRRIEYLGDWHTHPGGTTSLSPQDRQTLRAIAKHRAARCEVPVMVIAAGGDPWALGVWQLRKGLLGRFNVEILLPRLYE
jgi:integrative and conjugative element protein (TIGR02256 family)